MQQPRNSKVAPAVDKISSLPDAILSRILSLLSIKEAVATSILSKRWIHLWHSVDSIDFSDFITVNSILSNSNFNNFLYSVLLSRYAAGSHFTNRFCLEIEYSNPNLAYNLGFPNVNKCVNLIVQPGLKYLRLHLLVNDNDDDEDDDRIPKLPISILTCRTLVSLDLRRFCAKDFSFSSNGFRFPSLNVLNLRDICFNEVRDFMLLLAGCPILEDLLAVDINFHHKEDPLTIQEFKSLSLPKLINAHMAQCWCSCFPMKALSNAEFLCVETFMLCTKEHKVYEVNQPQCPCYDIPIFHNVTQLELHDRLELVARVLQYFPKLQKLELNQESYETAGNEEDGQQNWAEPKVVPQCLSSHLRTCTIRNSLGLQSELMLAKYILKNARNLQIMKIGYLRFHPEMQIKLSACPKASATCQLLYY